MLPMIGPGLVWFNRFRTDSEMNTHIVNSLGWRVLRPLQEQSIKPLLGGQHAILLAPTAGGKTEAAFLPVLSKMLSENWTGLSVLPLPNPCIAKQPTHQAFPI